MPLDVFAASYALSTWKGLRLAPDYVKKKVPAGSLRDALPDFELRDFGAPPANNPRLRCIWRMPFDGDAHERPVAVVSDQYELLQHRVLATWLTENLTKAGLRNAEAHISAPRPPRQRLDAHPFRPSAADLRRLVKGLDRAMVDRRTRCGGLFHLDQSAHDAGATIGRQPGL